jgi:hypothetical protein
VLEHFLHPFSEVMIRLPASAIILGPSDLKDFQSRQTKRQACEVKDKSKDARESKFLHATLTIQTVTCPKSQDDLGSRGNKELPTPRLYVSPEPVDGEYTTVSNLSDDQDRRLQVGQHHSPENVPGEVQPSQPSKDGSQYTDFVESPASQTVEDSLQLSSPFSRV